MIADQLPALAAHAASMSSGGGPSVSAELGSVEETMGRFEAALAALMTPMFNFNCSGVFLCSPEMAAAALFLCVF